MTWTKKGRILSLLLFLSHHITFSASSLILNEIAYSGSGDQCDGKDWIEILNQGSLDENMSNYTLHDDKGKDHDDAKVFSNVTFAANEVQILCKGDDFDFGIGSTDTVTLLDAAGSTVSSITLPGTSAGGDVDLTYAYFKDIGYSYTATPTPGAANVYTVPKPLEEVLSEQNEAGRDFFLDHMEPGGSSDTFDRVVDIHVTLEAEDLAYMEEHPTHELPVRFQEISVYNANDDKVISVGGQGSIRTKGQSSNILPSCLKQRNLPFQLELDTPFYGMEVFYLRSHIFDASYMREYASHVMLKKFGLPYLRCRPVRLFLNGEYIGFYTLVEAPTQAYVMQRSFGEFDPDQTALFKMKTMIADCPYTDPAELEYARSREVPDPYYFDRGEHRADVPNGADENQCILFFFGEIMKERTDLIKGYVENDETCGLAMVNLGRVDRDYGPKSIENAMIDFLDSTFYDSSVEDIKSSIDADQWIKNFASYAVLLNQDSVIDNINNWYLATTSGGVNDWRIVQYDHNLIVTRIATSLCSEQCGGRMIYWPILRPSCRSVEAHLILGRILNDETSVQSYLMYVEEFVNVLESGIIGHLKAYGEDIKTFVVEDPSFPHTVETYEATELDTDFDDYNTENTPLLKVLGARIAQVKAQLAAIEAGTLPRNGIYDDNEVCPDWRDTNGIDYLTGSTVSDTCVSPGCAEAAPCYDNSIFTCFNGEMVNPDCQQVSPFCDSCFPHSQCGTFDNESYKFVESDVCGSDFTGCNDATMCFDHAGGMCAFDGEILTEECKEAGTYCKSCFPHSRCGSGILLPTNAPSSLSNESPPSPSQSPTDTSSSSTSHAKVFIIYVVTLVTLALV